MTTNTAETNRKALGSLLAAIDSHSKEAVLACMHADYTLMLPGLEKPWGREEHWNFIAAMATAFPDMVHRPDVMAAEGDVVFVRGTATGTHTGPLRGHAPTGRSCNFQFMMMARIKDGKIREFFSMPDMATASKQLGISPFG